MARIDDWKSFIEKIPDGTEFYNIEPWRCPPGITATVVTKKDLQELYDMAIGASNAAK